MILENMFVECAKKLNIHHRYIAKSVVLLNIRLRNVNANIVLANIPLLNMSVHIVGKLAMKEMHINVGIAPVLTLQVSMNVEFVEETMMSDLEMRIIQIIGLIF